MPANIFSNRYDYHFREGYLMPIHTMTQVAAAGDMSTPTLCRRIREGRGPVRIRFGRSYVVTEPALQEWLARERAAR
jgi:hypothetical protein